MEIVPMIAPMASYEEFDLTRKVTDKIALIDADRYKHVVTYRVWQKLMQDGERHTTSLINEIIDGYLSHDIFNRFDAKEYLFCFSAPTGDVFRSAIAQEKKYKGHRKTREDPHFYSNKYEDMAYVFEYINQRYQTLFYDDIEADDLLSMLQSEKTFIFSHDGDLKQVPGTHWDMEKYEFYEIPSYESFKILIYQMLKGAAKDNIGGLNGFGLKALEKFETNIQLNGLREEQMVHVAMKLFTDRYGLINGFDTFVEMWMLCKTRLSRGAYTKDKYNRAFYLIDTLYKNDETGTAEHNGNVKD